MHRPQEIFNRLFKPYSGKGIEQVRADLKREASVLDLMMEDSRRLQGRLGKEDQQKMEEYLESVRALEKRVERTSQWTHQPLSNVDTKGLNLEVSHKDPEEYTRCMYDLLYLALQTDSTRFATLMLESEHSSGSEMWNYANYVLGYKGATHDIAHKRPTESGKWDNWRAKQHAYFLERLRNTPEGDSNMLDQTVVVWGSGPSACLPTIPGTTRSRWRGGMRLDSSTGTCTALRATGRCRLPTCSSRCFMQWTCQ